MIAKLPQQTEEEIQRLVDSGKFENPADVLATAVRLLTEQARSDELDALLAVGRKQTERGELHHYSAYRAFTEAVVVETPPC